jgi:hypothetical protein
MFVSKEMTGACFLKKTRKYNAVHLFVKSEAREFFV